MLIKQISLKNPQIRLSLITIGIIGVTFFSSQKFIVKAYRDKTSRLKERLALIRLEDEIANIYKDVNNYEKCLPQEKDPAWLLTQITTMTEQSKLSIESIEPLSAKQIPPYTYVAFKVKTICTFIKLVNFIELVESSPYILKIENIRIQSKDIYKPGLPKEELDKETQASVEMVIGTIC